jgi:hypothetical protein
MKVPGAELIFRRGAKVLSRIECRGNTPMDISWDTVIVGQQLTVTVASARIAMRSSVYGT